MSTIKDVAAQAGVSVSTVSRVINHPDSVVPSKRQAVLAAMQALDYRPNSLARALVSQRSDCVGLVVGEIDSPFFAQLMAGVHRVLLDAGKHVIVTAGYHQAEQERESIRFLLERRCDALIVHAKALPEAELEALVGGSTPVVLINHLLPRFEERCVYLDNEEGAYLATRHLLARGHRRIGYIGSNRGIEDGADRERGYQRALKEFGLDADRRDQVRAFPDEAGGHDAMAEVLRRSPDLTAVFAYNDAMAAGAINMLKDSGYSVPEEISVVGFDDVILARLLSPRLTTVRYPIGEMGALAAQLVLHDLDERFPAVEQPRRFTPRLIERHSVRQRDALTQSATSSQ
ncbi:LacI family DNA-binding transcriptional regulator [Saccharospirillum mangrovi]|uniref:LacI family DNA-binding transcriptional regulator n=1 Tax=Saccharospirillum mangrovi TaxID=2161747 RepID=UPI000D3D2D48|nr:substrate-binding domain-containing protein [Saccharospirillum mangrovi]